MGTVAEFAIRIAADGDRFGFAHQIPAQIDRMDANIDQRSAAGTFEIREPAARIAEPADQAGFGIIDAAQIARVDKAFEHVDIGSVAANVTDLKGFARFPDGLLDRQRFVDRFAQRLLAQYMLARAQRRDADLGVRVIPRAYADRVDLRIGEQFPVVAVHAGDFVFGRRGARAFRVQIADRDQLYLRIGGVSLKVGIGDGAAADHADSYFFHTDIHPLG